LSEIDIFKFLSEENFIVFPLFHGTLPTDDGGLSPPSVLFINIPILLSFLPKIEIM
jgi:hypothetical protein